jgi:predicted acylesterase/phospholipase RssA
VYLTPETHPNVKLWKAMRMSMSVPVIFSAFRYRNKIYIDGGLRNNFAIETAPNSPSTLGILLGSKTSPLDSGYSFGRFIMAVADVILKNYVKLDAQTIVHIHDSPDPTCPIQSIQSGLEEDTFEKCVDYGYSIIKEVIMNKKEE